MKLLRRHVLSCALLLLACAPLARGQQPAYEREDGLIWQVDATGRHRVDETVISVGLANLGPARLALSEALPGLLPGARELRAHSAGVLDLALAPGTDVLDAVQALRASGLCSFAEPNTLGRYDGLPDDPLFDQLWHLQNTGQVGGTPGADLCAPQAWDITGGDPSVVVAVIDSGVDTQHPDLVNRFFQHPGELAANGLDDDGNGFVDDVLGYDFAAGSGNVTASYYHGTAVAGVVAAAGGDGIGVAGLAGGGSGGQGCRLMALSIGAFSPQGSLLDDAIVYAADNGARVISLSLTIGGSSAINAAIDYARDVKGVFIACASGNNGSFVGYPASHPSVVAVGSSNRYDGLSSFSNGGQGLDLVAPGEEILMTTLGGGWASNSGTSFAAPQVSALAALLLSFNPALTATELKTLMISSARDLGAPGWNAGTGYGRVDALAALVAAGGGSLGSATVFGAGVAGVQGTVPMISAPGGTPQLGNAGFKLKLTKARAGQQAWLLLGAAVGALPFKGGTLLVDPGAPIVVLSQVVSNGLGATFGSTVVPLPIPNDSWLVDMKLFCQWIVKDAAGPEGFSLTPGMALSVGG